LANENVIICESDKQKMGRGTVRIYFGPFSRSF